MTVAAFCKAEGVSQPAFYSWKKRLASTNSPQPIPASNAKTSTNSTGQSVSRPVTKSAAAAPAFTTVQLYERSVVTPTIVRIGNEIEIELGTHVPTVDLIATKLMQAVMATSRLDAGHMETRTRSAEARRA